MQKRPVLNIFLLGDPAAGKATHATYLCKHYSMYDFDMGKELRNMRERGGAVKNKLTQTYDKGKLSPTDMVREISRQKILTTPKNLGLLFDGHPKMLGEAKLIVKRLKEQGRTNPIVIYLSIPMSETVKRMTERKADFAGKFGKRTDDNPNALKERVKYYRKNIKEVVSYFKTLYPYKKISSDAPVPEVRKILVKLIDQHIANILKHEKRSNKNS